MSQSNILTKKVARSYKTILTPFYMYVNRRWTIDVGWSIEHNQLYMIINPLQLKSI